MNDLISRSEAYSKLKQEADSYGNYRSYSGEAYENAARIIEQMPAAMDTVLKSVRNHLSFLLDCEIEESSNRRKTENIIKDIEEVIGGAVSEDQKT